MWNREVGTNNSKIKDSYNSNTRRVLGYAETLRWFVEIKELYIINTLFGDLDEESHKWQGVQFRFHPSAYHRDLIHVSPGSHIPTSLYIRKKDGGLLSTNYMTKKHIWPGSFQVEPGKEETLTIKMLKKNSRDFMFSIEMNGYM